eukprot:jgi/Botrbrau1/22610/Bobra.176_1s0040.1
MATSLLAGQSMALQAAQSSFAGKRITAPTAVCTRPTLGSRLVVRAEETKVAKVDRSKDTLWFASDQSLSYLDGSLPADYGFDPLGLLDPEGPGGFITPAWLEYSEVIHCRWAMLGAAGILTPEVLATAGVIPQTPAEVLWFKSGLVPPLGVYEKGYWTDPWSLFFIEVILVQFAELKRWQDFRHPGSQGKQYFLGLEQWLGGSGNPSYPGGPFFNIFGLGKTEAALKELKTKEVKNGRLAMIAVFAFGAQAIMTGKGPFDNLLTHLSDPVHQNILTNFRNLYGQVL